MNKAQRCLVTTFSIIAILVMLFPPFYFRSYQGVEMNEGYAFILEPPVVAASTRASVNVALLLTEIIVVAGVGAAIYKVLAQYQVMPTWLFPSAKVIGVVWKGFLLVAFFSFLVGSAERIEDWAKERPGRTLRLAPYSPPQPIASAPRPAPASKQLSADEFLDAKPTR